MDKDALIKEYRELCTQEKLIQLRKEKIRDLLWEIDKATAGREYLQDSQDERLSTFAM